MFEYELYAPHVHVGCLMCVRKKKSISNKGIGHPQNEAVLLMEDEEEEDEEEEEEEEELEDVCKEGENNCKVAEEGEKTIVTTSGSILKSKLTKLAYHISMFGMAAGVLCIVILMAKFSIEQYAIRKRHWMSRDATSLLNFFVIGITVLVVAVPEGLPLAITIALAYSIKKMLKDNNLVRHLHACETMGNATTICSDKTGTLTMNRMTVVESYIGTLKFSHTPKVSRIPKTLLDILSLNIAVNSSYSSKIAEVSNWNMVHY